jgi:hypothetical protein
MGAPVISQALEVRTATIANGASLSDAVDLGGRKLVAIDMPSSWTAASLTFQASVDGVTYDDLYDGATERTLVVAASRYLAQAIGDWVGVRFLRIRSGTAGTPVNQGGARTITLVVQP